MGIRVSFKTRQQGATWPELVRFWDAADASGTFYAGWVYDHLVPIFTDEPGPVLESWTLLSALAARTQHVRLGVMVTGNTYRNPALLVKMASSLDSISDGRMELGLGAGWNEEEHRRFGYPFPSVEERMDRLDDACQIVTEMVRSPTGATYRGEHYHIDEAILDPAPVGGSLPLTIGGRGEKRTLLAAARWADAWNLPAGGPDVLAHKIEVLRGHCAAVGRDPDAVEVSAQVTVKREPERAVSHAEALVKVGAEHIVFVFDSPIDIVELHATLAALDDVGFTD